MNATASKKQKSPALNARAALVKDFQCGYGPRRERPQGVKALASLMAMGLVAYTLRIAVRVRSGVCSSGFPYDIPNRMASSRPLVTSQ